MFVRFAFVARMLMFVGAVTSFVFMAAPWFLCVLIFVGVTMNMIVTVSMAMIVVMS